MPTINFNFNWQTVAAIIGLLGSLLGGVYFIEDRYVDEAEAGQALMQQNQKTDMQINGLELYILNSELLQYQEKFVALKRMTEMLPQDQNIKDQLSITERRLESIQQKIETKHHQLMESK